MLRYIYLVVVDTLNGRAARVVVACESENVAAEIAGRCEGHVEHVIVVEGRDEP